MDKEGVKRAVRKKWDMLDMFYRQLINEHPVGNDNNDVREFLGREGDRSGTWVYTQACRDGNDGVTVELTLVVKYDGKLKGE